MSTIARDSGRRGVVEGVPSEVELSMAMLSPG